MKRYTLGRAPDDDIRLLQREGRPILRWNNDQLGLDQWLEACENYLSAQTNPSGELINPLSMRLTWKEASQKGKDFWTQSYDFDANLKAYNLSKKAEEEINKVIQDTPDYSKSMVSVEIISDPYHSTFNSSDLSHRPNLEARGIAWAHQDDVAEYLAKTLPCDEESQEDRLSYRLSQIRYDRAIKP